jgi:hypothetical protein
MWNTPLGERWERGKKIASTFRRLSVVLFLALAVLALDEMDSSNVCDSTHVHVCIHFPSHISCAVVLEHILCEYLCVCARGNLLIFSSFTHN